MNASDLMSKANQAVASAKLPLDAGDADGACNRAYYAMFDAARAALLASGSPVQPEIANAQRPDHGIQPASHSNALTPS